MEKLKITKLEDLCGKYVNKFINFQWNEVEKTLYVYYGNCLVATYTEIEVLVSDYYEDLELDTAKEMTIREAINYIYNKYPNVLKVSFSVEKIKDSLVDTFEVKSEEIDGLYGKEIWNSHTPEEIGVKIL